MMGISTSKTSNSLMVDRLASGIVNMDVEAAMRAVDRGMYYEIEEGDVVDPYDDDPWRRGNLHLSAPCIYAKALDALDLKPGMSFLNLGSGTGYLNTIVGLLISPNGLNHGIEYHRDVIEFAEKKLQSFIESSYALDKYDFIEPIFVQGNCLDLDPNSRYDRIYLGAACTPEMEQFMKNLLSLNGILIMPFGNHLKRYKRQSEFEWRENTMMSVNFTQMILERAEEKIIKMPRSSPKSLKLLCRNNVRNRLRDLLELRYPEIRHKDCYWKRKQEIRFGKERYLYSKLYDNFTPDAHIPDFLEASERRSMPQLRAMHHTLSERSKPSARADKLAAAMTLARCRRFRNCMLEMFNNTTENNNNHNNTNQNNSSDNIGQLAPGQQSMLKYLTRLSSQGAGSEGVSDQLATQAGSSSGASSTKDSPGNPIDMVACKSSSSDVAGTSSSGDNEEDFMSQADSLSIELRNSNTESQPANTENNNNQIGQAKKKSISHSNNNSGTSRPLRKYDSNYKSGTDNNGDNNNSNDQDDDDDSFDDQDNLAVKNGNNTNNQGSSSSTSSSTAAATATFNDDRNNLLRAMRDIKARIEEARRDITRHSGDDLEEERDQPNDLNVEPCPPHYRSFCESLCERHFREKFLPRLQAHKRLRDADQDNAYTNSTSSPQDEGRQSQGGSVNSLKRKRGAQSPLEPPCYQGDSIACAGESVPGSSASSTGFQQAQKRLPISSSSSSLPNREQNISPPPATSSIFRRAKTLSVNYDHQEINLNASNCRNYNSNNNRDSIAPYFLQCGLNKQHLEDKRRIELATAAERDDNNDNNDNNDNSDNDDDEQDQEMRVAHPNHDDDLANVQQDEEDDEEEDDSEDEDEDEMDSDGGGMIDPDRVDDVMSDTSSMSSDSELWNDQDEYLNDILSRPRDHLGAGLNQPRLFAYSPIGFYLGLRNRPARSRIARRPMSLAEHEDRLRTRYPEWPKYGWRYSYINIPEAELYRQHMEKRIKTLPVPETLKFFLNLDRDFQGRPKTP